MFPVKRLLLLAMILISIAANSQVRLCVDVVNKHRENGAGQGVYDFNNKWTPGATLTVSFLGASEWQKQEVEKYAPLWCQYANIHFKFLDYGNGDVRISFNPQKGSYSFIGKDIQNRQAAEETMNLGWINQNTGEEQIKGVVLHEFGHTLGLLHEHMNPLSNIKWNKPVVYAYYMQYDGWDKDMVDRQVFDRYSVSMTNKAYDPRSIMHYPIPANFTLDGYSVGENDELSNNDIELIGELYPFNKTYPTTNKTDVWADLKNVSIDYNVTEEGKLGMRINQSFNIYNAQGQNCIMSAYFYNSDNDAPLYDHNKLYYSEDGKVATYKEFTPGYQNTQYDNYSVFIPYDEFELPSGSYRLKCFVALFDKNSKQIATGGYQYFTYNTGSINCKEVLIETKYNDDLQQIEVTPVFQIYNAKGTSCHATAYFFDQNGNPLKGITGSNYTSQGDYVASTVDFKPGYDNALYNSSQSDFKIILPYKELNLPRGNYKLQYYVRLFDDNWKEIVTSGTYKFTFTQN